MSGREDSVTTLLDRLAHPRRDEIDRLRAIIAAADPALVERVKWNAPSFALGDDDRITFHLASSARIDLIFHRGARARDLTGFSFADPTGLLDFRAPDRALLRIVDRSTIAPDALGELVRAWLKAAG